MSSAYKEIPELASRKLIHLIFLLSLVTRESPYTGSRLIVHWLIDQFWLIDQLCMEPIGLSSNRIHLRNSSIWLFDPFLAAKIADPLSGPLCIETAVEAVV